MACSIVISCWPWYHDKKGRGNLTEETLPLNVVRRTEVVIPLRPAINKELPSFFRGNCSLLCWFSYTLATTLYRRLVRGQGSEQWKRFCKMERLNKKFQTLSQSLLILWANNILSLHWRRLPSPNIGSAIFNANTSWFFVSSQDVLYM